MIEFAVEGVARETLKLLGWALILGVGIGILISSAPDVWAAVKPWIHSVTA